MRHTFLRIISTMMISVLLFFSNIVLVPNLPQALGLNLTQGEACQAKWTPGSDEFNGAWSILKNNGSFRSRPLCSNATVAPQTKSKDYALNSACLIKTGGITTSDPDLKLKLDSDAQGGIAHLCTDL